jgi:hypothetical protein
MKITMWQQFSSNHSAQYVIIGEFDDEHHAKLAYGLWYRLALDVEETCSLKENRMSPPVLSAVQQQIAEQYDIEWEEPIDWMGSDPSVVNRIVRRMGQRVFVRVDFETWQPVDPGFTLIEKLGASKTQFFNDAQGFIRVRIQCDGANATIERDLTTPQSKENVWTWTLQTHLDDTQVVLEDSTLTLTAVIIYNGYHTVASLLHYLEARGCHNIQLDIKP